MHKLRVFTVGKTKEPWLQEAISAYRERLTPILSIEWILAKNTEQLKQFLEKETHFFCLDPKGKAYDSEEFSKWAMRAFEQAGSRLTCVIGGAEGIPQEILSRGNPILSFSRLTFTHQLTRLILVEQMYRAFEIAKGSKYHK
ncbi:MAG: 23S rRNA (pseudouridine(1915)-N(3))-methyltransferase RlmH [Verrucomicrobia bacterium]|nr:23S rRNA (pseudouridine(1915)-N(3))-methyltransferase RlmH [Verrucomicrobiota bacterium]